MKALITYIDRDNRQENEGWIINKADRAINGLLHFKEEEFCPCHFAKVSPKPNTCTWLWIIPWINEGLAGVATRLKLHLRFDESVNFTDPTRGYFTFVSCNKTLVKV